MAKTTREAVVRAALKIFRSSGYAGFSLSTLAADLGIRKASLYTRFSGKDEIACATIDLAIRDVLQLRPVDGPWQEQYRAFVHALAEYLVRSKRCIGLHMGYGDKSPEVAAAVSRFFEQLIAIPEGILATPFETGRANQLARDCIGALEGATLWLAIENDPEPMRRAARQQVALAIGLADQDASAT